MMTKLSEVHTLTPCSLLIYLGDSSLDVNIFVVYKLMDSSIINEASDGYLK